MSNPAISCPHCQGMMSLPAGREGTTVGCPHCRKPFQVPGAAGPDFGDAFPDQAPRRRSPGRSPGSNPLLWIAIIAPCVGALVVVLFLWKGSGVEGDLDKGRIRAMYEEIQRGMKGEDALKQVRKLMNEFPGKLEYEKREDDVDTVTHEFTKGKRVVRLKINQVTGQVENAFKDGF
jgi:hypothetical protein